MARIRLFFVGLVACCALGAASTAYAGGKGGGGGPPCGCGSGLPRGMSYQFVDTPGAGSLVHPGYESNTALQLTSTGNGAGGDTTASGIQIAIPKGLTVSQITELATEYEFPNGSSCGGGSPRFSIAIPDPAAAGGFAYIFVYIGPPPGYVGCASGVWSNTGNLADVSSTAVIAEDYQLSGIPGYVTWAQVVQAYGNLPVCSVYLKVDGGWDTPGGDGTQTALFDNTRVDWTLLTYEPNRYW